MIKIKLSDKPDCNQEREYSDEQVVSVFCQQLTDRFQAEYGEGYVFEFEYMFTPSPGYYKIHCNAQKQLQENTANYINFELRLMYPKVRQLLTRSELAANPTDEEIEQKVEKRRKLMVAEVVYLSVRPPKKGVGMYLMEAVLEELATIKTLELVYISDPDAGTKGFWKKVGFAEPDDNNSKVKGKSYLEYINNGSDGDLVHKVKSEFI